MKRNKEILNRIELNGKKKKYRCRVCCNDYLDKKWADKCESWCKENQSCNLEIIKYAV